MTIINCRPSDDDTALLIAFDTEATSPLGFTEVSKVLHIPHMAAVLGGRGQLEFLCAAYIRFAFFPSFDDAAEKALELLNNVYPMAARDVPAIGPEQEILFAGWSTKNEMFRILSLVRSDERGFIETDLTGRFYASPWHPSFPPHDCPDDPAGMIALTEFQRAKIKEIDQAAAGGGRLFFARLERDLYTVKCVHTFAPYAISPPFGEGAIAEPNQ